MLNAFDPRIVRLTISINGQAQVFEGFDIRITGTMFASTTLTQARIKISNLNQQQRNSLLTSAAPFFPIKGDRQPVRILVDVGRVSWGQPFRLFEGTCFASDVTIAPDMGVIFSSLTNSFETSIVGTNTLGQVSNISTLASKIATRYGWNLYVNIKNDRQISNFNYTGSGQTAMIGLEQIGDLNVFLVNGTLHVMDKGSFVGAPVEINAQNGMVGIPQACEMGVKVKTLIRPDIRVGGAINLTSEVNPAVSGQWWIKQLKFELTSRDDPFWYEILGVNQFYSLGTG